MSERKKFWSNWFAVRILAVALGCALIAACETQPPPVPTTTPLPLTATATPEPSSTPTPQPTPTNTPIPEAPQDVRAFVDSLMGEFSLVWEQNDQTWNLNQHLTVQLTATETQTTDQTVARFNADGTQMTINVKGQDIQLPVSNFGQSADQAGAEAGSYQLIPGADVKTGIGFNLGIKDTVDDRVAYGYNVWGKWVENKPYQVGRLEVNDFNMFAGALQINPEKADEIYQGLVTGIYNIQVVTGNQAILDQYPTAEAFLRAAQSGTVFMSLNIPKSIPETTPFNRYDTLAAVAPVQNMSLNSITIGFGEQSQDRILHPSGSVNLFKPYFSFNTYMGSSSADAKIETPEDNGVSHLTLTLARFRMYTPLECDDTLLVESPTETISDSASQLLEQWLYTTGNFDNFPSYQVYTPNHPEIGFPVIGFTFPLYDLYMGLSDKTCPWTGSDLIIPNR